MRRLFLQGLLAAALPFTLSATELKPWFGNAFELEARGTYLFQNFQRVNTGLGAQKYASNDSFVTGSLGTNIYGDWNVELEITGAQTRAHCFNFDCARLTGRYLWVDDTLGLSPVSVASGLTLIQATNQSVHDLGSFHHGIFEAEIHTAVGHEITCGRSWSKRWWLLGALGMGTRGVPWLRGDGVVQFQPGWCGQIFELGVYTLWGTGNRSIGLLEDFSGYGVIAHQSVDVGAAYIHRFDIWGSLKIGYKRRIYAQNFPEAVNYLIVEYFYPFGL